MDSSRTQLLLLLVLLLSGSNGDYLYETVAEGEDVALSCRNITSDQGRCENTDWLFGRNSRNTVLFSQGQKYEHVTSALSLSENCSLGLKSVTEEQAGEYYCQQFIGSREESTDTNFILSVVKLSQEREDDTVTVSCSVSTPGQCLHTLKWLKNDKEVDRNETELQTSHSLCRAFVSFTTRSLPSQFYQSLKCEVTQMTNQQKVTLIPRPPREKTDDQRTTDETQLRADLLRLVVVSLGLVTLLVSVGAVLIGTRTKGGSSS